VNMKKIPLIHPFLFAIFAILFPFSHNIGQVLFFQTLRSAILALGFTLLLFFLFKLFLDDNKKAAILTSLFLVPLFSYGYFYTAINKLVIFRHRYLLLALGIIFFTGSYSIIKTRKNLSSVTNFLNFTAISLVTISLANIVVFEFQTRSISTHGEVVKGHETDTANFKKTGALPDIYYIILDGHMGSTTLKEGYGCDNSEFIKYLSEKGFYVVPQARSNYNVTHFSLPSSLNMEYVNYLGDRIKVRGDFRMPFRMINDNRVMRFLKAKGYKFVHFGSWWGPTAHNPYADVEYKCLNEFELILMKTSILNLVYDHIMAHISRSAILYTFDKLAEIPDIKAPTFTFAHIICPHYPYVFGRNGEKTEFQFSLIPDYPYNVQCKEFYLDQLIFIDKKVEELVEKILSGSKSPPIIILQSDHGWSFGKDRKSAKCLSETQEILNAYYLPAGGEKILYKTITPVNSFRLIFNFYFDTDFELLPDKSYVFTYGSFPVKFTNIEDAIDGNKKKSDLQRKAGRKGNVLRFQHCQKFCPGYFSCKSRSSYLLRRY